MSRAASLRTLSNLFPDLANTVLNLYGRAWTFTEDKLPPLAYSQSAVRFAKLLSAVYLSHGQLDDALLKHLVLNVDLPTNEKSSAEANHFPTKGEIVEILFRGYPGFPSETSMTIADHTIVLAGIATVLSKLGYYRKKALVLRELMLSLLPALVQARKDGAAEMGVHPAASLASLNASTSALSVENSSVLSGDSEQGLRSFLSLVTRSYGIMPFASLSTFGAADATVQDGKFSRTPHKPVQAELAEATASQALRQAISKTSGSQDLKIDVLRSCINICEALPDLSGALQYSADLLRIAGSGAAPGPDSSDGTPDIAIDEQVRLVNNISRTLSATKQLGLESSEADYWDDFLIRGIEAMNAHNSRGLQSHAKAELELVSTINTQKEKNPFIYNPFLKKTTSNKEHLLVAGEEAFFRVTLQNLYDFDVVVERVKLLSDGVPFEGDAQSTIIGPYRTQEIVLSGTPLSSGSLVIYGCLVKIKGCRERHFPTVIEPWSLKLGSKGMLSDLVDKTRPAFTVSELDKSKAYGLKGPASATLALKVLQAQPNITLQSISAPQAAIMLLEGESRIVTITLQNTSRTTSADLLLLSFDDSTTSRGQSTLYEAEMSATEQYELEHASAHRETFKRQPTDEDRDLQVAVRGTIDIGIEILGKPGLSYGTIQVDYGHLGIPKAEIEGTFYTRQLIIPLTTTVNASVGIMNSDIVALPQHLPTNQQNPLEQSIPESENHPQEGASTSSLTDLQALLTHSKLSPSSPPHCLLLLDLQNSWTNTLTITLTTSDPSSSTTSPKKKHTHHIQPSTTERIPQQHTPQKK